MLVMNMQSRGELRIDPGQLGTDAFSGDLELVVPYTDPDLARALLRKAVDFHCATSTHTFLVDRLTELASECPLPVNPLVVLARSRQEGFRYALRPESTILVGTYRHYFWRTSEERLARMLVSDGHKVALLHIEKEETHA